MYLCMFLNKGSVWLTIKSSKEHMKCKKINADNKNMFNSLKKTQQFGI